MEEVCYQPCVDCGRNAESKVGQHAEAGAVLCMIGRHACNPVCTGGQVRVVDFKERGEGEKVLVEVHIIVEAASQRGIIIGKGGSALKALGTAARADIEEFLGAGPPAGPAGAAALFL